ncbi:exonuclease [Paenibacillus apiarius]|uniref:Exonuclease n=1 Tax=Paenibacillus apiarius TaxID=46240 RepID=A0ABT4DMS6_9BACL|nr:exonuclease [Paenibacillus apiarius]MBN3522602.1 exonuclease [Paenibacillus apiarius]MCY9514550.1 exonuclease [Paenibacillus apiarius]MCY9518540.1 exonuclease [Paenibacillus apiarius]MCY9552628.1 exonuclease [Paenibacillus apiarius]MCY9557044.1 exonuclease [Paenibacillus apiarius]
MDIHHLIRYSQLKTGLLEIACQLDDDEEYTKAMAVRDLTELVEQVILLETSYPHATADIRARAQTVPVPDT